MIRKFSVKNYKNFKNELTIDFTHVHEYKYNEYCIKNDLINKTIIYGRNSVGKSNLGTALYDIYYNAASSLPFLRNDNYSYKNANAASDELIEFKYSFSIDSCIIDYIYCKKDASTIISEKLIIDNDLIFEYDLQNDISNFSNLSVINANDLNWIEFINMSKNKSEFNDEDTANPSALRYIMYNTIQKEQNIVYKLKQFISGMRFSTSFPNINSRMVYSNRSIYDEINLKKFQNFLNNYGIDCDLILIEESEGEKSIYFNYAKPLKFFNNISSGTAALTKFYFRYLCGPKPTFVYIDEFDAYYHFELSEKIVDLLENEFDCQVILTSHNTNLLSNSIMRPDCFMILSNGKITPICEATNRELRQGHNLEKLYMNGEFDGHRE